MLEAHSGGGAVGEGGAVVGAGGVVVGCSLHSEQSLQLFWNAHFCDHDLLSLAHQALQYNVRGVGVAVGAGASAVGAGVGVIDDRGAAVGAGSVVVGAPSHSEQSLQFVWNAHFCDHGLLCPAHQGLH
jgi:hypothetical protein